MGRVRSEEDQTNAKRSAILSEHVGMGFDQKLILKTNEN